MATGSGEILGALAQPVPSGAAFANGVITGNMDAVHLADLLGVTITVATSETTSMSGAAASITLSGSGFIYDTFQQLTGGTVSAVNFTDATASGTFQAMLTVQGLSAAPFGSWVAADSTVEAFSSILAGGDTLSGGVGGDLLRGYGGNDALYGSGGPDTIWGGDGDDSIQAGAQPGSASGAAAATYLRGEAGDDSISGGAAFDDINGNMGNDTEHGNAGDDWVVGGQGDDVLFGDAGGDVVWGNLGNDTLDGGDGNDQVRGGQGDDSVSGGNGNDYVSGDRGADTISGGAGADIFHGSQDAGIDRVIDFHVSEGDRVMLDPGTAFTVSQVGADTVIDMGGGNQMILVGVQMSSLPTGSIFESWG